MLRDGLSYERLKEFLGKDWELGLFSYIPPAVSHICMIRTIADSCYRPSKRIPFEKK